MKYNLSLEYAEKALEINEKILDNNISLSIDYGNIASIYWNLKKYDLSLNYAKKSLEIVELILDKNHPNLAKYYNNIAHIYKDLKECKKAREYMEKAKNIFSLYEYKKMKQFM